MAVGDRIAELEAALAKAQAERDELLKDVENLCMQGDPGTVFDKSSLLVERIIAADRDLRAARKQGAEYAAEAADLKADLAAVRDSKLVADRDARAAREQAAHLDRELAFYQSQSAAAMADRDAATWEAEELRDRVAELEERLRSAESDAAAESAAKEDAERGLTRARSRIDELSEEVKGLDLIPGLRKDLAASRERAAQLHSDKSALQDKLRDAENQLQSTAASLEKVTAERDSLADQLSDSAAANEQLAQVRDELTGQLEAATSRGDEAQAAAEAAQAEADELQRKAEVQTAALAGAREALESATAQKVQALMALSDAQSGQARAEERLKKADRTIEALRKQLSQGAPAPDGPSSGEHTPASSPVPPKPSWRGWLGSGRSVAGSPANYNDRDDASSAWSEGPTGDVHALRGQLAGAQERLSSVEAMAGRVAELRSRLSAIAAETNWDEPSKGVLTELDKLAEDAATLRVGVVLGLTRGRSSGKGDADGEASDGDGEGDLLSALSMSAPRKAKPGPDSVVAREVLDLLEVAIAAVRSRAAGRMPMISPAASRQLSRSNSQLPVVKAV